MIIWRVIIKNKKFILRDKKGFSLVEMVTVVAILAIIGALSFTSYIQGRKQAYVTHLANTLQADVRTIFINSISSMAPNVSSGACWDAAKSMPKIAKVWALRIPLSDGNFASYEVIPYCEVGASLQSGGAQTMNITDVPGYNKIVTAYATQYINEDPNQGKDTGAGRIGSQNSGTLYLIFASPIGKFYSFYASTDPDDCIEFGRCGTWSSSGNDDKSYSPTGSLSPGVTPLDRAVFVTFDTSDSSSTSEMKREVKINMNGGIDLGF